MSSEPEAPLSGVTPAAGTTGILISVSFLCCLLPSQLDVS